MDRKPDEVTERLDRPNYMDASKEALAGLEHISQLLIAFHDIPTPSLQQYRQLIADIENRVMETSIYTVDCIVDPTAEYTIQEDGTLVLDGIVRN